MIKNAVLLILILMMFSCLFSEAIFSPDHRSFDFGEIYEKDGKVSHKFKFKNTGDEPLIITDVHAS